jgi:UDP-N-acetylmuramoyl-tripeptide--D-alanyl-D-alanine ligase
MLPEPSEQLQAAWRSQRAACTDTRSIRAGDIFFALKGPHFNANAFAAQALEQGAAFAVVDDAQVVPAGDHRFILVPDVLLALQGLARWWRRQHTIPFIGITGSNGKTTTKELMHAVLSRKFRTHATKGNLNNHIGVPLTLLALPSDAEIAVIEMGANKPGDIAELCTIAEPTHGLITNVGYAHLEQLGSIEGVAVTKGALFHAVREHGTAWINVADVHVMQQARDNRHVVSFGRPGADYFISREELAPDHSVVEVSGQKMPQPLLVRSALIGAHNAKNILAAVVTGNEMGVPADEIAAGIEAYQPTMNRSQMVQCEGFTVMLDAYNANPSSMRATLDSLNQQQLGRMALILGDMFELGEQAVTQHRDIGRLANAGKAERVILVGALMHHALAEVKDKEHWWFANADEASAQIAELVKGMDFVLIKGSRGMALERLMKVLKP